MFHWTWFCILKLKIMKTILKLEVHRHQAFPQNLRLTRRHVDAQLGTLRSGDISLLYIHRWLGHNALESQAAALSEEGMLWVAKLIQHPPGALFIEDKSWAYSSTGSFCINWGNLSEGVLPSRCMQTNWGCWFFSQGCSETGCREMYGCCPGPTESVLQQQPHRPLIQRLLQLWPSRCFCLFGLQQLLYEACPAATVFVDFLFHSPAQLSMLCYKLPVLV